MLLSPVHVETADLSKLLAAGIAAVLSLAAVGPVGPGWLRYASAPSFPFPSF